MKITLYMAMSANGIIATETGEEEFLSHDNWEKFYSLAKEFGNFIVGKNTYEAVKQWDEGYNFDDLVGIEKVVISHDQSFKLDKGYTMANSPQDALNKLSEKGFETVLVTGGATINSAFAKTNLLDEIILNIEPVIVGKGIPLFAPEDFELKLKLVASDTSKKRIVTLKYTVLK